MSLKMMFSAWSYCCCLLRVLPVLVVGFKYSKSSRPTPTFLKRLTVLDCFLNLGCLLGLTALGEIILN